MVADEHIHMVRSARLDLDLRITVFVVQGSHSDAPDTVVLPTGGRWRPECGRRQSAMRACASVDSGMIVRAPRAPPSLGTPPKVFRTLHLLAGDLRIDIRRHTALDRDLWRGRRVVK